jgi:hypothetical protein
MCLIFIEEVITVFIRQGGRLLSYKNTAIGRLSLPIITFLQQQWPTELQVNIPRV